MTPRWFRQLCPVRRRMGGGFSPVRTFLGVGRSSETSANVDLPIGRTQTTLRLARCRVSRRCHVVSLDSSGPSEAHHGSVPYVPRAANGSFRVPRLPAVLITRLPARSLRPAGISAAPGRPRPAV